jgi:type I restriction enzyme S subunit
MSDELLELPEGWVEIKLGEICNITSSKRVFQSEYTQCGIPFYRTKEIKELANGKDLTTELFISEERYKEIKVNFGVPIEGDMLLTAIGTIGEIYIVEKDKEFYFKDGNVLWLKDFKAVNTYYLKLALASFIEKIKILSNGSTYNALPIERLKNHKTPLPPLNEQKRIVAKIEELSDRSQTAQKALETIPQLCDRFRKSVLAAAFRGDLTADWREKNSDVEPASQLLLKIIENRQQKYNEEYEELLLQNKKPPKLANFEVVNINFDIPEHWITISVESACLFIIDCLHNTPKFIEQGEYCIDTTCIEPFKINWDRARKVTSEDFLIRTSRMNPKHNCSDLQY